MEFVNPLNEVFCDISEKNNLNAKHKRQPHAVSLDSRDKLERQQGG